MVKKRHSFSLIQGKSSPREQEGLAKKMGKKDSETDLLELLKNSHFFILSLSVLWVWCFSTAIMFF